MLLCLIQIFYTCIPILFNSLSKIYQYKLCIQIYFEGLKKGMLYVNFLYKLITYSILKNVLLYNEIFCRLIYKSQFWSFITYDLPEFLFFKANMDITGRFQNFCSQELFHLSHCIFLRQLYPCTCFSMSIHQTCLPHEGCCKHCLL